MRTAAYARYSTDQQSAASIDDQLRNIRGLCARQGWSDPVVYSDAAMSGSRNDRPGYVRMLAEVSRFDVIVVDDLSRLSRDSIEIAQVIRRLTFAGVRVVGVSDGTDTGRKGHKAEVGLRGIMSELYLSDLADKTHRGLTGKALAGLSAGGLPYGYRVTAVGQRTIDEAQAAIVRRIYAEYLSGMTARQIAAGLNRDGVASARASTWAMTAIHGDTRRGIGILANPIYAGRMVWNRSHWERHPDTRKRIRRERPASEWVTTEHPELAIIADADWQAVQRRLRGLSAPTGKPGPGRPNKHLLSGILRCGDCGGPMVVIDRYRYGCATAKDRGTCTSRLRFPIREAEASLLAGIRAELLTEARFREAQRAVAAELKRHTPTAEAARRKLADAERVHGNIMAAIRAGIITPSTKAELEACEADVQAAKLAITTRPPARIITRLRDRWQAKVDALAHYGRNLPAAREALRELIGERITVRNDNGAPVAEIAPCQTNVVAGACCVLYLTEPVRIPLCSRRAS